MRYGVIADIHANLPALDAALAALRARGAERFLVLGDVVGYGPHPNECSAVVGALDATVVAGNHDLMALGRLDEGSCIELARQSIRWTREVLDDDARLFLEALPLRASVDGGIVLAHGTLDDPTKYTATPAAAVEQLARLGELAPAARILLLGHTHRPLVATPEDGGHATQLTRLPGSPMLLNPGAVGQSRELRARARALLLDLDANRAEFLSLGYDLARCRRDLRRAGLSPRSHHLRPSPVRRGRRVLGGALARTRGR